MTDFATWIRTLTMVDAVRVSPQQANQFVDLLNLCAQQHEALLHYMRALGGSTDDEVISCLTASEAFKEKYSHDTD